MMFPNSVNVSRFHSIIVMIAVNLIIMSLMISCSVVETIQDSRGRQTKISEQGITFDYPDDWIMVEKVENDQTTMFKLEKQGESSGRLIVTAMPGIRNREELIAEIQKMLKSSLYHVQHMYDAEEKDFSGQRMIMVDALAGDKVTIYVRAAAFSTDDQSYFFYLLCEEEFFGQGTADLDEILASVEIR